MGQRITLQFPCSFPVKVMGPNTEAFSSTVLAIIEKHISPSHIAYSSRLSSGNKYLSLTATITAQSKEQLDALYAELNAHELVLVTL